jgi:ribosomal protein S6
MQNNKEDMLVKVYELGYHLIPTLAEEEVPQYVNKIKDALDSYGAIVISEEMPKRIELAYTMHPSVKNKKQRYDKAYFGWVKFETDTQSVEEFKKFIDSLDEVFRSLIIITVRENTMAPKKLFVTTKKRTTKHGDEEKLDVAQVDKEIDALIEDPKDETIDTEVENSDIIEDVALEETN